LIKIVADNEPSLKEKIHNSEIGSPPSSRGFYTPTSSVDGPRQFGIQTQAIGPRLQTLGLLDRTITASTLRNEPDNLAVRQSGSRLKVSCLSGRDRNAARACFRLMPSEVSAVSYFVAKGYQTITSRFHKPPTIPDGRLF
jgi:hypothetical protein